MGIAIDKEWYDGDANEQSLAACLDRLNSRMHGKDWEEEITFKTSEVEELGRRMAGMQRHIGKLQRNRTVSEEATVEILKIVQRHALCLHVGELCDLCEG